MGKTSSRGTPAVKPAPQPASLLDEILPSDGITAPSLDALMANASAGAALGVEGSALGVGAKGKRKKSGRFESLMGSTWFVIGVGIALAGLVLLIFLAYGAISSRLS